MEYSQIYSILSLSPIESVYSCDFLQKCEAQTIPAESKIKKRQIVHPSLKKKAKKNGNMPKSIIGNFSKYIHKYKHLYSSNENYQSAKATLTLWLKQRFDLGLPQLKMLLGGSNRQNMENCRVLREILSNQSLEMIGENTKVTNNLSYLICFEKYVYRLANPSISGRIQSR